MPERAADRARQVNAIPLLAAVLFSVVLGAGFAAAAFFVGLRYLLPPLPVGSRHSTADLFNLLKIALAITGGIGAVAALVVALRRQRLSEAEHRLANVTDRRDEVRLFGERFGAAARLLGDKESPAVRMSGVYAMASLADDWAAGRQRCIDVLCGYMRVPYDPETAPPGEREVRLTVLATIRDGLQAGAEPGWRACNFDLHGAVIDGGNLDGACLIGGLLRLAGARFTGGDLWWRAGAFVDCLLDCVDLEFSVGSLRFDESIFTGVTADFSRARVANGGIGFDNVTIAGGNLVFHKLVMNGGLVTFDQAKIIASDELTDPNRTYMIDLTESDLTAGRLTFVNAKFAFRRPSPKRGTRPGRTDEFDVPTTIAFDGSVFRGTEVSFAGANFDDGTMSFVRSVIDGSVLLFRRVRFREAVVLFTHVKLRSGTLIFDNSRISREDPMHQDPDTGAKVPAYLAELDKLDAKKRHGFQMLGLRKPPATLDFRDAEFAGGEVNFTSFGAAGGVITFAGLGLADTNVRFEDGDMRRLLIVLWHLHIQPGDGTVEFEDCTPMLLLSDNMTESERTRLRYKHLALTCYEINDID